MTTPNEPKRRTLKTIQQVRRGLADYVRFVEREVEASDRKAELVFKGLAELRKALLDETVDERVQKALRSPNGWVERFRQYPDLAAAILKAISDELIVAEMRRRKAEREATGAQQ